MSREVWGTFAINDHCVPHAFVADVMLYDRLVIPVPPDNLTQEDKDLWAGYDVARQQKLLRVLGDRARPVKWDQYRRASWKDRFDAAKSAAGETGPDAFRMSRMELTSGLPPNVTAVESVSTYQSYGEITSALKIKDTEKGMLVAPGAVTAVLGREFLIVDPEKEMDDTEVLKEAVALSSDSSYCRKRANYWRWQREFLNYEVFSDEKDLSAAVEEMHELVDEQNKEIRKSKLRTSSRFAFLVGAVTLGMFGPHMIPVAISPVGLAVGKAFISVGQFAAERLLQAGPGTSSPAALFCDFQKHFGWRH
jgi:hypothetical protein